MTQEEQDADLMAARNLLHPTALSVDRCRHDSVEVTSLWIFDGRRQVGAITRLVPQEGDHKWKANRVLHGLPISSINLETLAQAIAHVTDFNHDRQH